MRSHSLFEVKDESKNENVSIQDIYVLPRITTEKDKYGETFFAPSEEYSWLHNLALFSGFSVKKTDLYRLKEFIETIAKVADTFHQSQGKSRTRKYEKNPDDNSSPDNIITRLITPEYSLYTRNPLSLKDYTSLISTIEEIASLLHENVHLVLSSFAVRTEQNDLLNITLYIECGEEPIIHPVCKSHAQPNHEISFDKKLKPFSQREYKWSQEEINEEKLLAVEFIAAENMIIPNKSVFKIETKGGAAYIQALDICFDHYMQHSKVLLDKMVAMNFEIDSESMPLYIDYLLSSNFIPVIEDSLPDRSNISHVNPVDTLRSVKLFKGITGLDSLEINGCYLTKHKIKNKPVWFDMHNASFGKGWVVLPTNSRVLTKCGPALESCITHKNDNLTKKSG